MAAKKKGPAEAATSPSRGSNNPRKGKAVNRQQRSTAPTTRATDLRRLRADCGVVELAERLAAERASSKQLDGLSRNETDERVKRRMHDKLTHAIECEYAVRGMIAATKASSLEGAAMQIAEIFSKVEGIFDSLGSNAGTSDHEDFRAIGRLIYSALDAIEHHMSVPLAELVDPTYGDRYLNPWLSFEDRERLSQEFLA